MWSVHEPFVPLNLKPFGPFFEVHALANAIR